HSCSNRRHSRDIRCGPGHAVPRAFTGSPDHIRGAGFTKPADPRCLSLEQLLSRAGDQLPGRLHPKAILFDIVLDHLTGNSVEPPFEATDPQLTQAIRAAGNVVLVCNAESAPRPEFSTVAAAVGDRGPGVADRANAIRGLIPRPV